MLMRLLAAVLFVPMLAVWLLLYLLVIPAALLSGLCWVITGEGFLATYADFVMADYWYAYQEWIT